jgi:NADPH:quinone reductase-like Zn-dependent oxidoreductase
VARDVPVRTGQRPDRDRGSGRPWRNELLGRSRGHRLDRQPGEPGQVRDGREQHLTAKPAGVPWEAAGALFVAGTTAYAAVRAVGLTGGDTVVVSGAAGGVGSISVQLAGAAVIGLASEAHHSWLAGHGVIPVAYGNAIADRIRQAASKVDVFIDTFGAEYVELALELGVEPSRIDTIVHFEAVARYGVKAEGSAERASASVLAQLAGLIAAGELELPIEATFPLDRVQDAYRRLEEGHVLGKIVLLP